MSGFDEYRQLIESGTSNAELVRQRISLAKLAAHTFVNVGRSLHVSGHIFGDDRVNGESPFGHGSDEQVGVAMLCQMAGDLVSASADLLTTGNPYAGSALLRQVVEIEYLAWAFNKRSEDAERWLRSDYTTRKQNFTPFELRTSAGQVFRHEDYKYHCEFGGHPTPAGGHLLKNEHATNQLLLSDLLGHASGIWHHIVGWAAQQDSAKVVFDESQLVLTDEIDRWHSTDPLVGLACPS